MKLADLAAAYAQSLGFAHNEIAQIADARKDRGAYCLHRGQTLAAFIPLENDNGEEIGFMASAAVKFAAELAEEALKSFIEGLGSLALRSELRFIPLNIEGELGFGIVFLSDEIETAEFILFVNDFFDWCEEISKTEDVSKIAGLKLSYPQTDEAVLAAPFGLDKAGLHYAACQGITVQLSFFKQSALMRLQSFICKAADLDLALFALSLNLNFRGQRFFVLIQDELYLVSQYSGKGGVSEQQHADELFHHGKLCADLKEAFSKGELQTAAALVPQGFAGNELLYNFANFLSV